MNVDTKHGVHPAFVKIIKQLSSDEAKLLKYLSKKPTQPLIDVVLQAPNNIGYIPQINNFTNIGDAICENPSNISSYIDNLERLKLIEIPPLAHLTNEGIYSDLENHPLIKSVMNKKVPEGYSYEIKKKKFELTSFGKDFIKICVI